MAPKGIQPGVVRVVALACLVMAVSARGPGGGGGGGGSYSDHSGGGGWYGPGGGQQGGEGSSGDNGDASAEGSFGANGGGGRNNNGGSAGFNRGGGPGFDIAAAMHYRYIHGILAAVAMVILFPVGSILLRVLPGRLGVWVHAVFQVLAMCVYIAAAALGIYLVRTVQIPGVGSLLSRSATNYHPIIGLALLALFLIQPVIGLIHHIRFKKVQKRQIWSYLHLFNGRVGVTLGIINGGLGLNLAGASAERKKVYTIVAAVMWSLWMITAAFAELRRVRSRRAAEKVDDRKMTKAVTTERRGSED